MALPSLDACDGIAAGGRCARAGREVRPEEVRPEEVRPEEVGPEVGSPRRWADRLPTWPVVSDEGEADLAAAALPRDARGRARHRPDTGGRVRGRRALCRDAVARVMAAVAQGDARAGARRHGVPGVRLSA